MTLKRLRSHKPNTIDPRTGRHIAAPDALWWTCNWVAAFVLSAPLIAWAAYTFWCGEFYFPQSGRAWYRETWRAVTGTSATMLSTTVLIGGIGMFVRSGVRTIDRLRPLVDRVEPLLIAAGAILVIGAVIMALTR